MKRIAVLLAGCLTLVLAATAQAEHWKGAGKIGFSDVMTTAIDRDRDALFAWTRRPAGIFSRSRPGGGPVQARGFTWSLFTYNER